MNLVTVDGPIADHVTVRPMSAVIGAELGGIDISEPLTEPEINAIRAALRQWRVVFFRDQDLDHASHVAFARQFGALTYAHPYAAAPPDGFPEVYTVESEKSDGALSASPSLYRGVWHTDVTPAVNPPAASILRAGVVPPFGGDTYFTNLVAAYEALSSPVKPFLETLRAEHRYGADLTRQLSRHQVEQPLVAHHPVVRVHPETGEKVLFVSPHFTRRILGLSAGESQWILDYLWRHLADPQFTVRFRWEPGSVAFWENRMTAHLPPVDLRHIAHRRVMHRVTLIGDVPVGTDGRQSTLLEGSPFEEISPFEEKPVLASPAP